MAIYGHIWPYIAIYGPLDPWPFIYAQIRPWVDAGGGWAVRIGAELTKMYFSMKIGALLFFGYFRSDLRDLNNGSGSNFHAEKWYWEVWKSTLEPFRDKSVIRLF